jgi:hypothetical protein
MGKIISRVDLSVSTIAGTALNTPSLCPIGEINKHEYPFGV